MQPSELAGRSGCCKLVDLILEIAPLGRLIKTEVHDAVEAWLRGNAHRSCGLDLSRGTSQAAKWVANQVKSKGIFVFLNLQKQNKIEGSLCVILFFRFVCFFSFILLLETRMVCLFTLFFVVM